MLDKIRLQARGVLPADYAENLGDAYATTFDARMCRFLRVQYAEIRARVLERPEEADSDVLAWAEARAVERGHARRTDEECEMFNAFLSKRGWRDAASGWLVRHVAEPGVAGKPVQTIFDYLDYDEGRDPVASRAWVPPSRVIVVMGPAGAGKTTLGRALAAALGWEFADADDFHPAANVAKMAAGEPLTDVDRAPWLAALRAEIGHRLEQGRATVLACSALKQVHREVLRVDRDRMQWVFLDAPRELLARRLVERRGHFAGPVLLDSQLRDWEPPVDALRVDAALDIETQTDAVRAGLGY